MVGLARGQRHPKCVLPPLRKESTMSDPTNPFQLNPSIRISIATTQGPAEVTRLVSAIRDPGSHGMRSMMLQQSAETRSEILGPAVEPNSYNDFVRLETGVIERLFGHAPFIMWVSRSIDSGESWQAGVLLAHAAYARGRLAMRDKYDGPFGISAWVTGIVSAGDFRLKKVTQLREKLALSIRQFEDARGRGARVIAFFPGENEHEVEPIRSRATRSVRCCSRIGSGGHRRGDV